MIDFNPTTKFTPSFRVQEGFVRADYFVQCERLLYGLCLHRHIEDGYRWAISDITTGLLVATEEVAEVLPVLRAGFNAPDAAELQSLWDGIRKVHSGLDLGMTVSEYLKKAVAL